MCKQFFRYIFVLAFSVFYAQISYSEGVIDSLLQLLHNAKNDSNKVHLLNRIAWEFTTKDINKSFEYGLKSLKFSKEINYSKGIILSHNNLAKIYALNGNYLEAISLCKKSIQINQDQFPELTAEPNIIAGNCLLEINQTAEGEKRLLKAMEIADKLKQAEFKKTASLILAKYYQQNKNFEMATLYFTIAHQLTDSLLQLAIAKTDIANAKVQKEQIFIKITTSRIILGLLIIVVFVLLFWIYVLYKNRSRIKQVVGNQDKILSLVASKTDNGVVILDAQGNFEWLNNGFTKMWGHTLESLLSKNLRNARQISTNEKINEIFNNCIINKKSATYEYHSEDNQGQEIWIQTTLTPIIENEQVVRFVAIDTDITELKLIERELTRQKEVLEQKSLELENMNFQLQTKQLEVLERNEELEQQKEEIQAQTEEIEKISKEHERLSIVASKTDNGVVIMDADGNFEWINEGFIKLYGVTLPELINKYGKNIRQVSSNPKISELLEYCKNTKKSVNYDYKSLSIEDSEKWIQTTLTPVVEGDKVIKFIAIDSDITPLKQAKTEVENHQRELKLQTDLLSMINSELTLQKAAVMEKNEELQQQKEELMTQAELLEKSNIELEKLSIVASKTDNGVVLMNANGDLEWVNDGFIRMHGRSLEQYILEKGKNIRNASQNPNFLNSIDDCIQNKRTVIYEYFLTDGHSGEKWIQTTLTPYIEKNEIKKIIAIDSDITKLKLIEQEVRAQAEEIQIQAERLDFAYNELKAQKAEISKKNQELEKLSLVASKTDNSIFIANPSGEIIWVNDAFSRHSGYSLHEFIKERGRNLLQVSSNPEIEVAFLECISKKSSVVYTSNTKTKKGKIIWLQTTLTPILDNNGAVTQLIAINTDITKIKEAEKKIAEQNKEINDSIMYASRIQAALLPLRVFIEAVLHEYFILNKPQHIVSGDFYWVENKNNKAIVAVADCTGHGIPGAFMSMLGIVMLKSIVNRTENLRANQILFELRERLIKALHQRGKDGEARDGMDLALCIIDFKEQKLQYSGAFIPLYLAKNEHVNINITNEKGESLTTVFYDDFNGTLIKYHADKMPIGFHDKDKVMFTNHYIDVNQGDMLYLCTDGYSDQFGGKRNRKFFTSNFQKLLLQIYSQPVEKQYNDLLSNFLEWKGDNEQVDDILVMGIRI